MPFLRQLYKQKPSAWGPASSVQASIFKNAERIGIDPASIALAMPMWGPGDQLDYANLKLRTQVGTSYEKNSIKTVTNVDSYITMPDIFAGMEDLTIIADFYLPSGSTNSVGIIGSWLSNTNMSCLFFTSSSGKLTFREYNGIAYTDAITSSTYIDVSGTKKWAVKRQRVEAVTLKPFFVNGQAVSYSSYGSNVGPLATPSTAQTTINRYSTSISTQLAAFWNILTVYRTALKDSQIAYLSDNHYFLLQRVPPVFYSVPGGAITIKTITDTGSCLDEIAQISNIFALSDTGSCLDGFSGLIAGLSVVDAGAGVDTVKPIAALTVQDTGSAIDLIQQISAACSVADTGTGTDSIGQLLAALVVSDAGAGADVITVLKELLKTVTDSGTGTDSISRILASLSVADAGSITDTISQILAGVSVSDTGTCVEFIALLKDILKTISDTGSGSDSVSIQPVSVSVQDAGTALDIIGHIAVALSVSDAGTIAEIISTIKTKMVTVTDTGTGSDSAPTISVSLTVSDTAAALDLVGQVINSLTVSDTGTGFESITKTDFDILPSGKVMVTFTIKTPGASFAMRTPKATFNIE